MFRRMIVMVETDSAETSTTVVTVEVKTSITSPATRSWTPVVIDGDRARKPHGGHATIRMPQPAPKALS